MLLYSFVQVSNVTRTVKNWYLGNGLYSRNLSIAREDHVISTVIVVPGIDLNFNDRKGIFKSYANNFN